MTKPEKNNTQNPNDHDATSDAPKEVHTESHGSETDEHKKQMEEQLEKDSGG